MNTTCNLEERIYSDYIRRYLFRVEYILDILGFWDSSISSLLTWNHKLRLVFWPFRSRSKQCAELLDDLQSYPQKVSETATDVSSDRVKYFGFKHHASVVRELSHPPWKSTHLHTDGDYIHSLHTSTFIHGIYRAQTNMHTVRSEQFE